jgi:exosortase/archaeosortase family protein
VSGNGTQRFAVEISSQCSGYEGIGLIWVFLTAYLFVRRKALRFPRALLLLAIDTVAVCIGNIVRIAGLIAIGRYRSPAIALGGFHSYAGSICPYWTTPSSEQSGKEGRSTRQIVTTRRLNHRPTQLVSNHSPNACRMASCRVRPCAFALAAIIFQNPGVCFTVVATVPTARSPCAAARGAKSHAVRIAGPRPPRSWGSCCAVSPAT